MTAAQATDVLAVLITTITIVASVLALAVLRDIRFRAWFRDRQQIRRLRQQVADLETQLAEMTTVADRACRDVDHFAARADHWWNAYQTLRTTFINEGAS